MGKLRNTLLKAAWDAQTVNQFKKELIERKSKSKTQAQLFKSMAKVNRTGCSGTLPSGGSNPKCTLCVIHK